MGWSPSPLIRVRTGTRETRYPATCGIRHWRVRFWAPTLCRRFHRLWFSRYQKTAEYMFKKLDSILIQFFKTHNNRHICPLWCLQLCAIEKWHKIIKLERPRRWLKNIKSRYMLMFFKSSYYYYLSFTISRRTAISCKQYLKFWTVWNINVPVEKFSIQTLQSIYFHTIYHTRCITTTCSFVKCVHVIKCKFCSQFDWEETFVVTPATKYITDHW